jgi:DNA-binding XRE family transcriptional regulator
MTRPGKVGLDIWCLFSYPPEITLDALNLISHVPHMLIASQIRAARALLGIDQRQLAEAAGLSLPTIQRMEASTGPQVRGNMESVAKVVDALERAGVELISDGAASLGGGRGVRLKAAPAAVAQSY